MRIFHLDYDSKASEGIAHAQSLLHSRFEHLPAVRGAKDADEAILREVMLHHEYAPADALLISFAENKRTVTGRTPAMQAAKTVGLLRAKGITAPIFVLGAHATSSEEEVAILQHANGFMRFHQNSRSEAEVHGEVLAAKLKQLVAMAAPTRIAGRIAAIGALQYRVTGYGDGQFFMAGRPLPLTPSQLGYLLPLFAARGRTLPRSHFIKAEEEETLPKDHKLVDVQLSRIRRQIRASLPEIGVDLARDREALAAAGFDFSGLNGSELLAADGKGGFRLRSENFEALQRFLEKRGMFQTPSLDPAPHRREDLPTFFPSPPPPAPPPAPPSAASKPAVEREAPSAPASVDLSPLPYPPDHPYAPILAILLHLRTHGQRWNLGDRNRFRDLMVDARKAGFTYPQQYNLYGHCFRDREFGRTPYRPTFKLWHLNNSKFERYAIDLCQVAVTYQGLLGQTALPPTPKRETATVPAAHP